MSAPLLVADSGALIALARLDLLALPARIFAEVWISATVWTEVTRSPREADMQPLLTARLLGHLVIKDDAQVAGVPPLVDARLDEGELSALGLALSVNAVVLMDERLGRQAAQDAGLSVLGTLGLLLRARDLGLVGPLRPLVEAMQSAGYYLAQNLIDTVLAAAGE